jgi:hypothetical protein
MVEQSSKFPGQGTLPQRIRRILYPDLTDHEVETIVVCLLAHLLIENSINELVYRWLKLDAPLGMDQPSTNEAKEKLWKNIVKMDFARKYSLLEPFLALHFPEEAKNPWKINDLRNEIFHGRAIKEARFDGMPISDEKTVEAIFVAVQSSSRAMDKFEEILQRPIHEYAEYWKKRLEELGESLY